MLRLTRPIILGLVLLTTPVAAQAGWRAPPPHTGPRDAPPPPLEERPRNRPGHVWVGGHHDYRRGHYVWVGGHLVRERRGRDWNDGRWERHEDHWDYHRGEWRPHR